MHSSTDLLLAMAAHSLSNASRQGLQVSIEYSAFDGGDALLHRLVVGHGRAQPLERLAPRPSGLD